MKIAYISTYPPRECGIATFNHNLMNAINANFPDRKSPLDGGFVVAPNDSEDMQQRRFSILLCSVSMQATARSFPWRRVFLDLKSGKEKREAL